MAELFARFKVNFNRRLLWTQLDQQHREDDDESADAHRKLTDQRPLRGTRQSPRLSQVQARAVLYSRPQFRFADFESAASANSIADGPGRAPSFGLRLAEAPCKPLI